MKIKAFCLIVWFLMYSVSLIGQSIVNTPHDLSTSFLIVDSPQSGGSTVCGYCHTPHVSASTYPLAKRFKTSTIYPLYTSSTIQANPGQPSGSSVMCLSCHDGTVAMGHTGMTTTAPQFSGQITEASTPSLSTDLSDDHPISFDYQQSANSDPEIVPASSLPPKIWLEDGQLQCTSCHDPHDNSNGDFLHISNIYSQLCTSCHNKEYWSSSSHKSSQASWNGAGTNPWPHTSYSTVAKNGCENCHTPHSADGKERLLTFYPEEESCLNCHNGNVASTNIRQMLTKPYKHDVYSYQNIHDPNEDALLYSQHVECADCHNPHAVTNVGAAAPVASGKLKGIKGITSNGTPTNYIQFQFELCYRCHADSPSKPGSKTPRQIEQDNVRLEFDLNNPSYHPVEGPGKNNNVPSLISPYTEASTIYCTDCHGSDGANSPDGPHGSIYPSLLKYNYSKDPNTSESYFAYELCYQCHDRNSILSKQMGKGKLHSKHVVRENVPCNTCHDPHGISSSQGNSVNNSHLINFDVSQVSPDLSFGRLEFVDTGNFSGECYLYCHGKNHAPKRY